MKFCTRCIDSQNNVHFLKFVELFEHVQDDHQRLARC